ncbi:ABC transporter ATP-binding protein [Dactylosporangium roseum]|uniref:ABC transporter ATP-binding protein n=1 Tax=Dactylosporangium roseum TaxID=47989 RepID=A0ABY5ZEJ6_9ACTN|nr:ABC transporter ATP-binding protein [Dactylosporangium roseum]UWZ39177.1 ABC transporter ATP-binding protein [Dactylosporangium roseum]
MRNASIAYGPKNPVIVNNVSFDVDQGEAFILIGRSGCGKSTLLRSLAGFQELRSGQILLDGKKATAPGPDRMMVFQNFDQLLPWRTAVQNVEFAIKKAGSKGAGSVRQRALDALQMVHLSAAADKFPSQLSGGMQQRVAIARALAVRPRIVLMDEPFGALDAMTRASLQAEVLRLQREMNMTLVFVTHSIEEAVYLGDRIGLMTPQGVFEGIYTNAFQGRVDSPEGTEFAGELRTKLEASAV